MKKHYVKHKVLGDLLQVTFRPSPFSQRKEDFIRNFTPEQLTEQQLLNWECGMSIQKAMPNLTEEQREMFLTGIDEAEQSILFGDH